MTDISTPNPPAEAFAEQLEAVIHRSRIMSSPCASADAVLACDAMQAVRRLIAAELAYRDAVHDPERENTLDKLIDEIVDAANALPASVRGWAVPAQQEPT